MRIERHPILKFDRRKKVRIFFNNKKIDAYQGESVAAALHAAGHRILSRSVKWHRPRGFYCAIGKCSTCAMRVNGKPNVRVCVIEVKDGMRVESQNAWPSTEHDFFSILDKIDFLFPLGFQYHHFPKTHFLRNLYEKAIRSMSGVASLPQERFNRSSRKRRMKCDIAVIGGGPAGLVAAAEAAATNKKLKIILLDENKKLGGQLVKQTHKFFGSVRHGAGTRGIVIAKRLVERVHEFKNIRIMPNTSVIGIFGKELGAVQQDNFIEVLAKKMIIATGAYERSLIFENNDLPGVYGAGAAQTLMNVNGVRPGDEVLMIGAGNVGLIVSYQLLQAGVKVKAIIEAAKRIGGYQVHAAKVRRLGVPILTSHTVKRALGNKGVKGALVVRLDENWKEIPGSEREFKCDVICVAVGLKPTYELLYHAGCEMRYVAELGGYVAVHNKYMQTTNKSIYVAGDVAGIEEASTAMLEGCIAGISAALDLVKNKKAEQRRKDAMTELAKIRASPFGARVRAGLLKLRGS